MTSLRARRAFLVALALSAILPVEGCGGGGGENGAAPREVRVGAVVPLSGGSAATGRRTLEGIRLAAAVVNEDLPGIDLPLAEGSGLPDLNGARVRVIPADNREDPEFGAAMTERLIKRRRVAAVIGSYFSSVTLAASERAERLGVPFVNGDSSAPGLTERGSRPYFFRTGPSDRTFADAFFNFLDQMNTTRRAGIETVAVVHENTEFGTGVAEVVRELAAKHGYSLIADIPYPDGTRDVAAIAARIKRLNPHVLFQASYTPEAVLFTRTFRRLHYRPNLLAFGAGYSDAAYFDAVGQSGTDTISRAAWALDAMRGRPAAGRIAAMFRRRYATEMDENSARDFTAALTLFEAIDEAGSTDPNAVRDTLAAIDIPGRETIMPWAGIRFDRDGQNALARGLIVQRIGGAYRTIWPFDVATANVVWPIPGPK